MAKTQASSNRRIRSWAPCAFGTVSSVFPPFAFEPAGCCGPSQEETRPRPPAWGPEDAGPGLRGSDTRGAHFCCREEGTALGTQPGSQEPACAPHLTAPRSTLSREAPAPQFPQLPFGGTRPPASQSLERWTSEGVGSRRVQAGRGGVGHARAQAHVPSLSQCLPPPRGMRRPGPRVNLTDHGSGKPCPNSGRTLLVEDAGT